MQKGWKAKGLLRPLWLAYGGRDELAAAVGSNGTTLSNVNAGSRDLGIDLGRRLAGELKISLAELGAPAEVADDRASLRIVDRLQALEAAFVDERQSRDLERAALLVRLADLEEALEQVAPGRLQQVREARTP